MADGHPNVLLIPAVDSHTHHCELALAGRVYADVAAALEDALQTARAAGVRTLLVDATRLEQIDALALRMFVDLLKHLRPRSGRLVFYGLSPLLVRTFALVGLDRVVEIVATRDDALRVAEVRA